jgi:formate/nitrite transporter
MSKEGLDAFSPAEIAEKVETVGVAKANLPWLQTVLLGLLAGAFIGLGAVYFLLVVSDSSLGFAASRVLGGMVFSMGLLLVVVAGAELFTGNNLLVMAWADGRISHRQLLRNWLLVCLANFIGSVGLALLVAWSGYGSLNGGKVGVTVVSIAAAKCAMPATTLFFKGVLCNALVCLAVWMALAGRSVVDKLAAIFLPISAFVTAGFEHSIANMFIIPLGLLLKASAQADLANLDALNLHGLFSNLGPVIAGNLLGGSVLVALIYYLIYRRNQPSA